MTPEEKKIRAQFFIKAVPIYQRLNSLVNEYSDMGYPPSTFEVIKPGDVFNGQVMDMYYINFEVFNPTD